MVTPAGIRIFLIASSMLCLGIMGYAYAKNPQGCWKIVHDIHALFISISPFNGGTKSGYATSTTNAATPAATHAATPDLATAPAATQAASSDTNAAPADMTPSPAWVPPRPHIIDPSQTNSAADGGAASSVTNAAPAGGGAP